MKKFKGHINIYGIKKKCRNSIVLSAESNNLDLIEHALKLSNQFRVIEKICITDYLDSKKLITLEYEESKLMRINFKKGF